jgi:hypothetical protein
MCILEDLRINHLVECKECGYNNICKLEARLKRIQNIYEAKRIIIKYPEIINEMGEYHAEN